MVVHLYNNRDFRGHEKHSHPTVTLRNRPRCERDAYDMGCKMSRKCLENMLIMT